jgi:hypothetical protein
VCIYKGVSKSFRTGHLEQELQMVQLSATRCSCITIFSVSQSVVSTTKLLTKLTALDIMIIISHMKIKKYISKKIINYNRPMGIIDKVFQPTLVQIHTRIRVYKTLAQSMLC